MEMEMPTKAEARAQALFKTATGNGNSYTRNIYTVKYDTSTKFKKKILFAQQSPAEKQHNKTKIKIKTKRKHHLKFLINLYFKLILCISHLNETILKLFQIKSRYTNNNSNNNNSENCIINLQQNEKDKAYYYPRISFKIVINFLTSFHCPRRKNLINYVQLTIRHFVGICLKRLISLMRLQQIPESSKITKQIQKHGHKNEKLKPDKAKFKESFKALFNWREKQIIRLSKSEQKLSKFTQDVKKGGILLNQSILQNKKDFITKKSLEESLELSKELPEMYKRNYAALKNNNEEQIEKTYKLKIKATWNNNNLNFKFQNFSKECSQLNVEKFQFQHFIKKNGEAKSNMIPKVQKTLCSNKRILKKIVSKFQKKYKQLPNSFIYGNIKLNSFRNLDFAENEHYGDQKLKFNEQPEDFSISTNKHCQLSNTFKHSCGKKYEIIFDLKLSHLRENNKTLRKDTIFKQQNFFNKILCWQLKTSRVLIKQEIQGMFSFHTELHTNWEKNHQIILKCKKNDELRFSPNSPLHQIHLYKHNNRGESIFHTKLLKNMNKYYETALKLRNNDKQQFARNSPLQQKQLIFFQNVLNFNLKENIYVPHHLSKQLQAFLGNELSKLAICLEKHEHTFLLSPPQRCSQRSTVNKSGIIVKFGPKLLNSFKANQKILKIGKEKLLEQFSSNSPLKWSQTKTSSFVLKHDLVKYVQIEAYLRENLIVNCQKIFNQTEACDLQIFSTNSPQASGHLENCGYIIQPLEKILKDITKFGYGKMKIFSTNSLQIYCQLEIFKVVIDVKRRYHIKFLRITNSPETVKYVRSKTTKLNIFAITVVITNSPLRSCHLSLKSWRVCSTKTFNFKNITVFNLPKIRNVLKERYCQLLKTRVSLKTIKQRAQIYICFNFPMQKRCHFNQNDQIAESKNLNSLLAKQKNNETISIITDKQSTFNQNQQPNFNQKFCFGNGLQKQSSLHFINGEVEEDVTKMKLAFKVNIERHFQLDDNNNSYQAKSKQQVFLKKCQHILYAILLSCYCYFCYWHINGFPLVLVKSFKYLKDATVHVLTRRLKIAVTTAITNIATSICYYCSNNETACDGKLKKLTKVPDDEAKQENIFKRQQAHKTAATTSVSCSAYSSSCCSTTLLTASSSYGKSLRNLILLKKLVQNQPHNQQQHQCSTYSTYQQYRRHRHHYHYKHNQQKHEQAHQQQQQQQQLYTTNSTIHLQLPSLLVFSRTLIILILLSSLWHTSEGFHGSTVKLSTNTVKTKYGLVRGIVVRSSPSLVEAYLGIPYASPPVGSLRFMPPITPSTWKNVRNADRFSPVCPQNVPIPPNGPEALLEVPRARLAQLRRLLPLLSNQSEDCLYLNIYVPYENRRHRRFTTTSGEYKDAPKLPTILFIHGESYEWNSGNPYDGSELAAHGNVIVVTINFRLGILGFLKTGGKESAQGNFGLMDLVAGLHWLKENLPAFGGDPQQITLLGHGTGAALANILVVSPVASDLIQHTVMVSGSALSPWAIQKNPLFVKRRVAEQTGCHGDMLYYDLAPCLRTKSVAELLAVKIDHPRFLVGFAPFIDGTVISPNTDAIGKLSLPLGSAIVSTSGIEFANFPKRNFMFCLTSVESHLDLNAQDLEFGFNETRRDRILRTYVRNNFHYHLNEIFAVLKNEYTDWDQAIRSPLSSRDATLQFLSDGHTASSLIKLGYMHSLRGGKGYFLHFKHRTVEEEYPQRTGSVRGEDVPFWLGLPISPLFPHNYTTQEKQISRLMLRYLTNFAKTGNPNQSSVSLSLPSASSLMGSAALSSSPSSSPTANDLSKKIKRNFSLNLANATSLNSSGPNKSHHLIEDVATAAAREALNLAVLYNQRRTKRTYFKRHSRSNNEDHSGSASSEVNYFANINNNDDSFSKLDSSVLPFWDAYDVVNQLYMELSNKAEIQSHYRGHKLSMWLNLIPQLHRHANMNDQSMRHHQFQDDLNNLNLYEGIVRAQIQTKPDDDDETLLLPRGRPTSPAAAQEANATQKPQGGTTECGVDGAMFVAEMTTVPPPTENRSLILDSREKEMATASTGIISNLEILRRLSGKQFPSYATALIATVAVGCFLFILNILIFAGIYHQREKRAKDAKTKEELQDNDTSKNSSMLKLNTLGSETGSFNGSGAGVSGKTTVVFGEYSCYDEKSLPTKEEKLIVELPPKQMVDANWASCSTSTLDLLKTKHHTPLDNSYALGSIVPINTESQTEHLTEMATYNPLPMATGLIIDPAFAATSSAGLLSKRGSFVGSSGQLNQYDFASVQSSDQMSFKDIENAVKVSATMNDDITQDDDIPEPPPPPRSFQSMQQQQQHGAAAIASAAASGSGGGGILRQAGTSSATQTGGGKKRVHIQEISV